MAIWYLQYKQIQFPHDHDHNNKYFFFAETRLFTFDSQKRQVLHALKNGWKPQTLLSLNRN